MSRKKGDCAILENWEAKNETLLLANADYEEQKRLRGHKLSTRAVERFWKLRAGQLSSYRANRNRRKFGRVTPTFKRKTNERTHH
jgi:hypothetical protein